MYHISEKRPNLYTPKNRPAVTGPAQAALHFTDCFLSGRECFTALFLDARHRVIDSAYVVSVGSLNASLVHPRELFREAIARRSAGIILAHNHPSGDLIPSPDDMELTERLDKAGHLIGIAVLDHLIMDDSNNYVSIRELGWTS